MLVHTVQTLLIFHGKHWLFHGNFKKASFNMRKEKKMMWGFKLLLETCHSFHIKQSCFFVRLILFLSLMQLSSTLDPFQYMQKTCENEDHVRLWYTSHIKKLKCEVWTYLHVKDVSVSHLVAHSVTVFTEYCLLFSEMTHAPSVLE